MKKNGIHDFTDKLLSVKPCMLFHSNFAAYIVCRRYKLCEFLEFVWTNCWGNKSIYAITSLATCLWPADYEISQKESKDQSCVIYFPVQVLIIDLCL